jgi:hypothetical protein
VDGAPPKRDSGRAEFVPSAPKASPPADELEFLRATVGEVDPAPPPAKPPAKAEKEKRTKSDIAAVAAPAAPAAEAEPLPTPKGTPEVRTLKCPECGTMNRPTEWYCERCGSELAGV